MAKKAKEGGLDLSAMSVPEAIEALNKEFGANSVVLASEAEENEIEHISTGVYALDIALGGGFPKNRMTEIRGPFSSFKSTISLVAMASFHKTHKDGYGIYVDVENSFDRKYAKRLGVDLKRLLIVNPDSGEQAGDLVAALVELNADLFMIVDSLAALVPTAEVDGTMEQQYMGLHPRLVGRMLRVLNARMKRNKYRTDAPSTTAILLNQVRQKLGVMYGDPETAPGGIAREHYASVMIRLFASKSKENCFWEKQTRNGITRLVRMGQRVDFRILKNKCGGPQGEEGDFEYYEQPYNGYPAHTFNNLQALFDYGAFHNVIDLTPGGYEFGKVRAKKPAVFIKKLARMPVTQEKLYQAIIKAVQPADKPEEDNEE